MSTKLIVKPFHEKFGIPLKKDELVHMSNQNSKIVEIFRKIGNAVLNAKNLPSKLRKAKSRVNKGAKNREIPSFLQNFMQSRHAGWPEYVMLKAQVTIILLFVSVVLFIALPSPPTKILAIPILLTIGYLIYLTPTQLKETFNRDYPAYRSFILLSIGISILLIFVEIFVNEFFLISFQGLITLTISTIGVIIGSFIIYRVKYGRNFTYGIVEKTKKSKAAVKLNYDIKSNVTPGLYFLESLVDVEPGDEVKVEVDRSFLGLRGSEPTLVKGKI